MPKTEDDNITRRAIAERIAQRAGKLASDLFSDRTKLTIDAKGDLDFVSIADRKVEDLVRAHLAKERVGEHVLGEECGGNVSHAFWVVDPIDGTMNFLRGSPLWGVCLAYVEKGQPVVGVMHYPILGYTLSANVGSLLRKDGVPVSRPDFGSEIKTASIGESRHWAKEEVVALAALLRKDGWAITAYRCACVGLGFAAIGHTDGYVEKGTSIWDVAAGIVIGEAAGLIPRSRLSLETGQTDVLIGTPQFVKILQDTPFDPGEPKQSIQQNRENQT